ncbi:hypothetical protein Pelo_15486 [Pelomyxa schiedti]|nr:hypothetical protein Pelo_15486 [Pelomyxa schiedti]
MHVQDVHSSFSFFCNSCHVFMPWSTCRFWRPKMLSCGNSPEAQRLRQSCPGNIPCIPPLNSLPISSPILFSLCGVIYSYKRIGATVIPCDTSHMTPVSSLPWELVVLQKIPVGSIDQGLLFGLPLCLVAMDTGDTPEIFKFISLCSLMESERHRRILPY